METDTVIVLAQDQASFHEFLKLRQEQAGGTRVILDRREPAGSSNGGGPSPRPAGRRAPERRAAAPQAALALMSVLGFMVLHRQGERWST
ncbi:MAG: hypothetical protein DMD79_09450 [Candidatus Rokuibacteriota bacterium]|nr:MAG: hypothetical protein DMD79_09450 [Candidatus Rokubacteria bacterium]